MKKLIIILSLICMSISIISCQSEPCDRAEVFEDTRGIYNYNEGNPEKSVKVINLGKELAGSSLSLKKVYVQDKNGYTHEILVASNRMCSGGEHLLELCKYKDE